MGVVFDVLCKLRRIKCLTVVDDFTKESVGILVEHDISSFRVTRVLDEMARFRDYPKTTRTNHGRAFSGKTLDQWTYQHDIKMKLIQAGKPTQNAFIESSNAKLRDKRLNEHWLCSLDEARSRIAAWWWATTAQCYAQPHPGRVCCKLVGWPEATEAGEIHINPRAY